MIETHEGICDCGNDARHGQRTCRECHNAYMRMRRHFQPDPYNQHVRARALSNMRVRRCKMAKEPCSRCGDPKAEKHHPDYDKPYDVVWLCRPCHLELHGKRARIS